VSPALKVNKAFKARQGHKANKAPPAQQGQLVYPARRDSYSTKLHLLVIVVKGCSYQAQQALKAQLGTLGQLAQRELLARLEWTAAGVTNSKVYC
jgi:hypothetical protein